MVLRNRPTLTIGTERLACLNSTPLACSWGPSPSTWQVPGSSPGPGERAACAFFLHPPFLPPSGDSFFRTFPTNPAKVLGLLYTTGLVFNNPNTIKSYKILLQKLSSKHAAHCVAQSTYPYYRNGKVCLSKQLPLACSWVPSPSTRQVPGSSPGPGGCAARAFFLHPPFLLQEIAFFAPTPPTPQ